MNITKCADMDLYTQLEIANKRGEYAMAEFFRALILEQQAAKKRAKVKKVVFCDEDY